MRPIEIGSIPPGSVKPHVKDGKAGAANVAAICEAVTGKTMRFPVASRPSDPVGLCADNPVDKLDTDA